MNSENFIPNFMLGLAAIALCIVVLSQYFSGSMDFSTLIFAVAAGFYFREVLIP